MTPPWAYLGSVGMFVSVAIGAFAAHGLKQRLTPEMMAIFEVGVRYQVYHVLGLFVVAWMAQTVAGGPAQAWVNAAGWLFVAGIAVFSGSLYALSLSGVRWLGAITPLGGLCFLAGWATLAAASWLRFR
jgi:uncharacterized membrane protein YgdD (TMEM256/DUF423 family)